MTLALGSVTVSPFRPPRVNITRDAILFITGLVGVLHETIAYNGERPSLLVLFAGMMGLPLYLRKNGK